MESTNGTIAESISAIVAGYGVMFGYYDSIIMIYVICWLC